MTDKWYQIVGLLGFILSGLIFIAVGIKYGDILTILGSVIWTVSCLVWMIPLLKTKAGQDHSFVSRLWLALLVLKLTSSHQ